MTTVSSSTYGSGTQMQVTGLASGLDTASIISSLMAVEAQPQTRLKNSLAAEQSKLAALQSLNTAVASLASSAQSFENGSTWTQLTTSSTSSHISVTAASSATKTTLNVVVDQVAKAASSQSTSSDWTIGTTYTLYDSTGAAMKDADGNPITFTVKADEDGNPDLSDIASQINGSTSTTKLVGSVIHADDGDHLTISSKSTGATSNFSVSADGGTTKVVDTADDANATTRTTGVQAQITVDGQTITSSSNTFKNVEDGLDLSIDPNIDLTDDAQKKSTIAITDDGSSRANAVSAFISQLNAVLKNLSDASSYGKVPTTVSSAAYDPSSTDNSTNSATGQGALAGNSTIRQLASDLVNSMFGSTDVSGQGSITTMGISVDNDGNITFDATAFKAAYQADPDKVTAAFAGKTDSFASRVYAVANGASDKFDGSITQEINSENSTIDNINDSIDNWSDILAQRQSMLEKQYANLETALSKLQSQSSWLQSQLEGLDDSSN